MINEKDLPDGWKVVELPKIVFFQEGPGVRKYQFTNDGIKLLNGRNIVNNKLILDNTETYISREEATTKYNHFLVEEGDLIIASSGIKVDYFHKKIAFAKKEHLPLCMNTSTIRFRALNNEILDIQYFKYFLMTHLFAKQVNFHITGSAQLNFGPTHLKKMKVILPPLQTQKKIVAILEKAERLKEWRKEADELTDEFLKSTFLEMFGDPINNDHDFDVGTIRDLTIKTQYGTSKKANEDGNGIPILRMGNITYNGNFDFSSLKHIEFDENEKRKYLVNKGELLFNRTNSKELVGKSAVYQINEPMAFAGYLIKLITDSPATSEFIAGHLNSKYGKLYLQKMAKNIVGMANINAQEVQNIPILIPPIESRQKFASIVQQVEQLREHQSQSRQHIDDLFNVLMQKAFKGELN